MLKVRRGKKSSLQENKCGEDMLPGKHCCLQRDSGQTREKQGRQKDISLKNLKGSLSVLYLFSHFQSFFFVFWIRASLMFPQAGPKLLPFCVRTLLYPAAESMHSYLTDVICCLSFRSQLFLPLVTNVQTSPPHSSKYVFLGYFQFFFLTILCMYILVLLIY